MGLQQFLNDETTVMVLNVLVLLLALVWLLTGFRFLERKSKRTRSRKDEGED